MMIIIMVIIEDTAQKMKFSIKDFSSKYDQIRRNLQKTEVTFTKENLHGKLHFSCSETRQRSLFIFVRCIICTFHWSLNFCPSPLLSKSMDWFLYDRDLHYKTLNVKLRDNSWWKFPWRNRARGHFSCVLTLP